MARIRIVTDSASDLPAELAAAHGVSVVPLEVRLEGTTGVELGKVSAQQFWQYARASEALATTAAPSPGDFQAAYAAARDDGCDGVCCITISSRLSATYQAASAGTAEMGDFPITVVDSRFATMGEGLLVLEAAKAASAGEDLTTVVSRVSSAIDNAFTLGTVDTLDYLRKGGRIGSAQAFVGALLSIKPVIEVRDGVVEGESRQRTRTRSLQYLVDKVRAFGRLRAFSIVHADAEDLEAFLAMAETLGGVTETVVTYIGPVIGAHTGPGTIGVCGIRA